MKKQEIGVLLGNRIRELREVRGYSQAELARRCLKSVETISNFERGKTIPSVTTLASLAKLLGVEISSFFEIAKSKERKTKSINLVESRMRLLSTKEQDLIVSIVDSLCKIRPDS